MGLRPIHKNPSLRLRDATLAGECRPHDSGGFVAASDYMDMVRWLALVARQWDHWKAYALELHVRLKRVEPATTVMHLNSAAQLSGVVDPSS